MESVADENTRPVVRTVGRVSTIGYSGTTRGTAKRAQEAGREITSPHRR